MVHLHQQVDTPTEQKTMLYVYLWSHTEAVCTKPGPQTLCSGLLLVSNPSAESSCDPEGGKLLQPRAFFPAQFQPPPSPPGCPSHFHPLDSSTSLSLGADPESSRWPHRKAPYSLQAVGPWVRQSQPQGRAWVTWGGWRSEHAPKMIKKKTHKIIQK